MRLTPWLSLLSKSPTGGTKTRNQLKRPRRAILNQLERLEDRLLLTVPVTYVDQNADFVVTTNNAGGAGADPGDIVTWNGDTTVTGLVFGVDAFDTIPNGITGADAGGTVKVAAGEYRQAGVMNITKSVTIAGVGTNVDDVLIQRTGPRGGNEERVIEVSAPNVTISHLKVGGWQNAPTVGELGQGYNVWTTQPFTTLDEVNLYGDDLRVGVYFGTSNDFTFTDSRITGTYFRMGIRGGAERMNISYNSFEESHYIHGPIYFEYGAPTSGSIDHNYFVSRVGVNNDALGDFKSDGTELYAITNYQPNVTTAAGLKIEYNTFIYQDAGLVNGQGASPNAVGVYISPTVTPSGPISVKNNIFQGYDYTLPVGPTFVPGGKFGGGLQFDGVDDYATFQSAAFDVGTTGTLSFWVKMDDTSKRNQFFEGPGNDAGLEFQYRTSGSGQFYGRSNAASNDFVIRNTNDANAQGDWTNLQFTWDFNASNVTGKMHIYRDGVESAYLAGFTPNDLSWAAVVSTVNGVMNVGRDPGDTARFFDGTMDDVAWFNRVLTGAELTAIRTSPTGVAGVLPSGMVAYWDLDDAPGTVNAPGDGGTSIVLNLNVTPPVSAIIGPATTVVDYNLFYQNDQNYNAAVSAGANNIVADPKFYEMGTTPSEYYALRFGSPALNASSDFPGGGLEKRHIGAYQDAPIGPPDTVYVNDNWAGTLYGTDPDGAGPALFFGVDAFATIQDGVDGVADDGLVIIYNGTYAENVTITRQVTLDGESAAGITVNPPAGTAFTITGAGNTVVIQDLTITGAAAAFSVTGLNVFTLIDVAATGNASGGSIGSITTFTYTAAGGADVITATGTSLSNTGALLFDEITLSAIGTFSINGAGGGDTFNITPPTIAQATNMTVNGDAGTDTLVVDTAALGTPVHNVTGAGAGNFTSTTHTTLFYTTMEFVDTTTAVPAVITGTAGNDVYEVQRNGANLEIYVGGVLQSSVDFGSITTLTFNGLGGSDTLLVDYFSGIAIPVGGIFFDGGAADNDKLAVRGTGAQTVIYTPDAVLPGKGVISIDGALINFTNLEPVDFDNVGSFTLNLPNSDDAVTVTNAFNTVTTGAAELPGTVAALAFSGTSNGVAFETANVFRTANVTVDTTAVGGNDTITITSADNSHGNTNLTFDTGTGTDNLIVNGATVVSGTFTGTVPLVNLNNNITAATITGTPTVVNVNNSTAQIQDGVDIAAAGATVNVAGGFTYAEAVNVGKNLSLVATGTAGNASISATTGPALAVSAGTVILTGFNATTSFASETIQVSGGSLKLRQNSIVKSGTAPGASLIATGAGVLNLGANPVAGTADPGQNSITGSGALVSSATSVDASGNWWGTTVQATIGTTLTANVDYSPFLNSGTDIAPATPGFQSSLNDITVHTAGPQTGPDARITEGYNTLAATGTIHVLTGIYTENVDLGALPVDKAVVFNAGASPGQVQINGSLTLTSNDTLPIELTGFTPPGPNGPLADPTPTNFDNFVVTGTVTLGNATLLPILSYGAEPYQRFTIINNLSAGAVVGTFGGLVEGSVIQVPGGPRLRISYIEFHNPTSVPPTPGSFYGNGNDVSLTVMTPPILVTQGTNGDLTIDGTGWNDDLTLSFTGTNQLTLIGNDVTNFTGPLTTNVQLAGPYNVTGNITVKLGNGKDKVLIRGVGPNATYDSGNLTIDLGSDDDTVTTIDNALVPVISSGLRMTGSLSILGDTGIDNVTLGSLSPTDTLTALNVSVDTGTGAGDQTISLDRLTANGNVTLANGGAGAQTVAIGGTAVGVANSIRGNLIINQLASASSFTVGVHNTSVGGFVAIKNGNGSGAAAVTIDTTVAAPQTIFGSTTIINGNNLSNAVTLSGFGGGLQLRANVSVTNGAGTNSNNITVTDIVNSGTTSSSFTNGSSLANTITFNGVAGTTFNSFLGLVAATNGTSTGTNVINATRLSSAKGINLTNGNATTSNTVVVGGAAALDTVGVTGNLVIANGTAGTTTIDIDRLTTLGPVNFGNVTMTNKATGVGGTGITFGAIAANAISGNVQITNDSSTGPRAVTMNRTTVGGRAGVNIYQLGAGDTSLTVGNNQAVTIARGLTVQDGSGASSVALLNLTAGSLTYTDMNGGVDTLDLADSTGFLRVNGVTRIDTADGSDTVRIATTGTAILNDTVFIALGSGDDLLFIGTHANSAAFNGSSKFTFDGGTGEDIFNASPLSIAEYSGNPLGKKVKSKIKSFETLLINP